MIINMCSSSTQLVLALFLMILLSYKTHGATDGHQCSTLCGDVNVSHPFRLKDYPDHCGDRRYNLSCEHSQLILYWQSGKYYVLFIDYDYYTIRLRDADVVEYNYSSLPRYSLAYHNFSFPPYPYRTFLGNYGIKRWLKDLPTRPTKLMIYVRCKHGVDSSQYVDTAPCMEASNGSAGSWSSYSYWNVGSKTLRLRDLGLEEGCRIELMHMTSWPALTQRTNNLSCTDIHSMLLYGFELSWLFSFCGNSVYLDHNKKPRCLTITSKRELILLYVQYVLPYATWFLIVGVITTTVLYTCAKFVVGTPFIIALLIYKWRRRHLFIYDNIEDFLQGDNNIVLIRYSYKDIKNMTQHFKVKLGKGGYGSVFRGQLRSGRLVAVKMLDKAETDGQDFINEVATLGQIHHVNVVQLIGYCVEGSKRGLIYELMQNGSLDKYIYSQQYNDHSLNCDQLYAISLGIARGIEYLHKGCNMQILHFDIKPHNILLDDNFNPKISDFGLAKLYSIDDSIVSLTAARGTIGYMAPELFYRNVGKISYKADVYSFGMLLMDMAGRRKNWNVMAEHSSQFYFPFWVYDQLHEGKEINIVNTTDEEMKLTRKMMKVGLWCIQTKPNDRPPMNKVVEMLEGEEEDMEMPPKPYFYPQDLPAMDVRDHSSSTRPSFNPSGSDSNDPISLLAQENDRSV